MNENVLFKNANIFVTGAASGIGLAVAEAFAARGANLALADIVSLQATEKALSAHAGVITCHSVDVSSESSVVNYVEECVRTLGSIDIAIHCAGVIGNNSLLETTASEFDHIISVNLRGTFLVGREVLRHMKKAGIGRLINIASDLSYVGREEFSPYCASKAGVLALTRSWAHEFAPHLLVNAICPGPIDTAMLSAQNMSPEWREKERNIPLQRFGKASEVAAMAIFLAGAGGEFITGQGFGVNGGSVMN